MVALDQGRGDLDGHRAIKGVIHGGGGTRLRTVRLCGMGVTSNKALDIYVSPYLIIFYLLRSEQGDLEDSLKVGLVT